MMLGVKCTTSQAAGKPSGLADGRVDFVVQVDKHNQAAGGGCLGSSWTPLRGDLLGDVCNWGIPISISYQLGDVRNWGSSYMCSSSSLFFLSFLSFPSCLSYIFLVVFSSFLLWSFSYVFCCLSFLFFAVFSFACLVSPLSIYFILTYPTNANIAHSLFSHSTWKKPGLVVGLPCADDDPILAFAFAFPKHRRVT
ncbi:hypothetical protein GE21DRAFT_1136448 [Neurospora crassa]|nr:hypothetical protein GE21DRAFT_1136448 [Neurospora crassa]